MPADLDSLRYFRQLHGRFAGILRAPSPGLAGEASATGLSASLLSTACQSFDANVAHQTEGQPPLDCGRGCATCCTLRVTATAPEVLWLAAFIRAITPGLMRHGIDLRAQVERAHAVTQGLGERERVASRQRCPFIARGVCVIYQVRPLACRGLASHDRRACARAAAGQADDIPYSAPHMRMRGLVQNAMQSALRDAGLSWLVYELNEALLIALDTPDAAERWAHSEDVFAAAQVCDVDPAEMAATFDQIKALPA
jgi:hypothetical protein